LGTTKWWQVDLGANQAISKFVISHAGAGGENTAWNTKDFNIQVSTDGTNWSTVVNVTGNTANVTTHTIPLTTARYVRLNIVTPTQNTDTAARIYEVEVYNTDLAFGKATTADSSCSTSETPDKAVNGSVSGGTSDKWCSLGTTKWWQVDLGASQPISKFVISHAGAGGESTAWNTKDFNIQVSNDGTNWSTVVNVTGNTANVTTSTIATTTARYVRLNVVTPTQNTDTAARIYEVEVYQ
jgi:alpha-acetolactate decarboxylase